MKHIKLIALSIFALGLLNSCSSSKKVTEPTTRTFLIDLQSSAVPEFQYKDLDRGIQLYISADISGRQMVDASETSAYTRKIYETAIYKVDPTLKAFMETSMTQYMRSMGISVGRDATNDYTLRVRVKTFNVVIGSDRSVRGVVELDYTLTNLENETLLRQTTRGRYMNNSGDMTFAKVLDKAYAQALSSMDWNGIVGYLKVHKRAAQEPNRRVEGDGNTALEHTVIRWNIESRPAGADVTWRVVSSTPDVKNTNSKYVGTTPYETTESFDIIGLSARTAGNVQIEVKCEKPGYLPQTRRFNLLQAIEQKEISAKFNLIKDED